MAANLHEVVPKNFPDFGPLYPNSCHVVVADFNQLLQAVGPWRLAIARRLDLLPTDLTQASNEVDYGFSRQVGSIRKYTVNTSNHFCRSTLHGYIRLICRGVS